MSDELRTVVVDATTRIFEDLCTPEVLGAAEAGRWPESLWNALAEAGVTAALVPEEAGGAGLGFEDGMALVRLAGYFAAPVPLAETIAAAMLLGEAGLPVPDGPLTLAPAGAAARFRVERASDGGWRLGGTGARVPWGGRAAAVVAAAASEDGERLVAVDPGRGRRSGGRNVAFEPRDTLAFDDAELAAEAVAPPAAGGGLARRVFALGALLRTQQLSGAMQRVLDLSVQYANERVQFGRPIAKFQAIQQQLAAMAGQVAAAGAAADGAAEAWGTDGAEFAVAVAKARTGEAAGQVAAVGHQVHGAMGFTQEHVLHHSTRRLWAWRDEFGNEALWQERLGRAVLELGADGLWPYLTGGSAPAAGGGAEAAAR